MADTAAEITHSARLRGLYAITQDGLDDAVLLVRAEMALRGGARLLQYRDKSHDAARRARTAQALRDLTRRFDATLIINDDVALALAVAADGVHLGGSDGDLAAARARLGPSCLLGASCYADFERARAAVHAGADYVAFGAVFTSPTKPLAVRAGLELFGRCRRELGIPACAIGGITFATAPAVIAAGADMLAVITDLFAAADIAGRARAFQSLFSEERAA